MVIKRLLFLALGLSFSLGSLQAMQENNIELIQRENAIPVQETTQEMVTICDSAMSKNWQLPKSAVDRCQTIKYMIEDIDLKAQQIPLAPAITAEQLDQFVPVLIRFDGIKKSIVPVKDDDICPICLNSAKDIDGSKRAIARCCKKFICVDDGKKIIAEAKELYRICQSAQEREAYYQARGYYPRQDTEDAKCPLCRSLPFMPLDQEGFAQRSQEELIPILQTKSLSHLCMIAHVANALECTELLEVICYTIAQKIKSPECIKECLKNGGYDFTINKDTKAQLAPDIQRMIANRMLTICQRNKIALKEKFFNEGNGIEFPCRIKKEQRYFMNSSGDNVFLVSKTMQNTQIIRVINGKTGELIGITPELFSEVDYATMSNNIMAVVLSDGRVLFIDMKTNRKWYLNTLGLIKRAHLNNAGDKLITILGAGQIQIWDVATGNCLHNLDGLADERKACCFNRTGDRFAFVASNNAVYVYETATARPLQRLPHTIAPHKIKFDYAGNRLVLATRINEAPFIPAQIHIWDIASGNCIRTIDLGDDYVRDVNFNQKGDKILAALNWGAVILDISTGRFLKLLHLDGVMDSVNFGLDDNTIIGIDQRVSTWPHCNIYIYNILNKETERYLESKILPNQVAVLLAIGADTDLQNPIEQNKYTNTIIAKLPATMRRAFFPSWTQWALQSWNKIHPDTQKIITAFAGGLSAYAAWYGYSKWFKVSKSNQQ